MDNIEGGCPMGSYFLE